MNSTRPFRAFAPLFSAAVAMSASAAFAQDPCAARWLPGPALTDVNGTVTALANWDPDGAGPLPSMVVVGGTFTAAGRISTQNIALWNPVSGEWSALGDGVAGTVNALAVDSSGGLIVGGDFLFAGELSAKHIARWDGTNWASLGAGLDGGTVSSVAVRNNGDIIVSGSFTIIGGVPTPDTYVASWNGSAWTPLGPTTHNNDVKTVVTLPNGDIVATLQVQTNGFPNFTYSGIGRWTGSSWQAMGPNYPIKGIAALNNGDLVIGDLNGVSRWNGSTWTQISGLTIYGQFGESIDKLTVTPTGDLLASGPFSAGGGLMRWNGSTWSSFAANNPGVQSFLGMPDGSILLGSIPLAASGTGAVFRWDGTAWRLIGPPVAAANSNTKLSNGDVIVCGNFINIGGVDARNIARWDGTRYWPLGAGLTSRNSPPIELPDGSILIVGRLTGTNGTYYLLRWDGTAWTTVTTVNSRSTNRILRAPDGSLLVSEVTLPGQSDGGFGRLAKWDGTTWSILGQFNNSIFDIAYMPNGDLIAAGAFGQIGNTPLGGVARWNGTSWSRVGTNESFTQVRKIAVMPNGDLIVGGAFTGSFSNIARWNGATWSSLSSGVDALVLELEVLSNGKLAVGGTFTSAGGVPGTRGIACWDGAAWSSIGGGVTGLAGSNTGVSSISELNNTDLFVSGVFIGVGNVFAAHMSQYTFGGSAPLISHQPAPVVACVSGSASFSVTSTPGAGQDGPTSYQWRKDGSPLGAAANPSAATATLSLTGLQTADRGDYTCVVSNACGAATTSPARLLVSPADMGTTGGTPGADGAYNNNDFIAFINAFFAGDTRADLGKAGGVTGNDGLFDNNDFIAFISLFFAGC
ncbi:MAG: GC-type dockerin domain-anchored protein [Phycisphaerales bacterium]